jgi:hypothetical protein
VSVSTLVRRRRRTVPRRRAATALRAGRCLFACHDDCDQLVSPVGLRGRDDSDAVLVCRHHLPLLRRLRPIETERLARYLHVAFAPRVGC